MSLSNGRQFTESELQALDLWDTAQQFGEKKVPKKKIEEPPALTVKEIEKMQQQAFDEAYQQGKEEGFSKGFEEGRQQGFEEGRTEGLAQGFEENKQLLTEQAAELVKLLESFSQPFLELDERVEQELVKLAIGIAHQLVRRELKTEPGQIIAVIREAVQVLPISAQALTLHMHPEDAELVRSSLALDDISPPWKIIEDPLITRGGCELLTDTSVVDATVESRLAAIVANIMGGEREEDKANDSSKQSD